MTVQPMMASFVQAAGAGPSPVPTVLMMVALVAIFYFLLIRPQQKRMKEHKEMVAAVKRGDTVVTAGGLIGKVVKVGEEEVQIDLAEGVRVRAVPATLQDVRAKPLPKAANTSKKSVKK